MKTAASLCLMVAAALTQPVPILADTPNAKLVQKEMKKFLGTWQLVSAETDGKKLPAEQAKQIRVVISENKHTVYFGKQAIVENVTFQLDPAKDPKWTTDTLKDGRKIRGIYELKGDTLRSCVAGVDKPRPTKFTGAAGSGCTLRVFKRVESESKGPTEDHKDSLRGTWTCVSAMTNGKPIPDAVRRALRLELGRPTYRTYRDKTRLFDGTYVIHTGNDSPQIDITSADEKNKGKTALGIYALKGNTLKLCYAMPGQARPQRFESTSVGTSLIVWQRAKR